MLAYAWKCFGWFLAGTAVALGFLLVPLQVAAERKKLDHTVSAIAQAQRDIRALETEFDTRANLAQLERWNGDTLRLTAPAAGQFVTDEAAFASLDGHQPLGQSIQTAALVVPTAPTDTIRPAAVAAVAPSPGATKVTPAVDVAVVTHSAMPKRSSVSPALAQREPIARASIVRTVAELGGSVSPRSKLQTVAMLDRKLLSDGLVGDLAVRARSELGRRQ